MLYYQERYMSKKTSKKGDLMFGKYLDPITDFGFKKLLGEEIHSNFLKDLLNELLRDETGEIVEITYLPNEQLPETANGRRAVFDIYCKSDRGEYFIVEMQKQKQHYFKDRSVYYSTFPIRAEAMRRLENTHESWDYQLKPVYTICFVDFWVSDREQEDYLHYVKLTDQKTHEVFYDKLTYVYVELKKFNKTPEELVSKLDYWIYTIKYLGALSVVPAQFKESIFEDFFEVARVAHMSDEDLYEYNLDLHDRCQRYSTEKTAHMDGFDKGFEKGIEEGHKKGIQEGQQKAYETILEQLRSSGMSQEDIDQIIKKTRT